ncbi:Vacuolar protein sorting-associated protein [Musa troglodytarum]|uniref:Vacuolar protein sorting-associated protein n=1 Tax=Musa troglodytarum TaxID=320322 RepID=A0A9E7GFY0_9LILI|nr:Vacuolar protein sorting-associated protein [Musa troglodytarum]
MYSNFKEQAIEYVKQAVREDNARNYVKAFPLYMNALEYFRTHLKYEKNPKIKEVITQKAGLESAKQALQVAVILPVKFPQFFTGLCSFAIFERCKLLVQTYFLVH